MGLQCKPKSKEIRQRAWDALGSGPYWPFVGGNFVLAMITNFAMFVPGMLMIIVVCLAGAFGGESFSHILDADLNEASDLYQLLAFSGVVVFASILVVIPLTYVFGFSSWGSGKMALAAADRDFKFGLCVSGWGHGWKMGWTVMVQWTYLTLWYFLLIIPGILKTFSYAMTMYVQVEHPDWGANRCIEESMRLMKGNRWRLFKLGISFIGWWFLLLLLAPFCLSGIATLFLMPYPMTAFACFYRQLLVEKGPALP